MSKVLVDVDVPVDGVWPKGGASTPAGEGGSRLRPWRFDKGKRLLDTAMGRHDPSVTETPPPPAVMQARRGTEVAP